MARAVMSGLLVRRSLESMTTATMQHVVGLSLRDRFRGLQYAPYMRGLRIYSTSPNQSLGELRLLRREVGTLTEEGDNAFDKRNSSMGAWLVGGGGCAMSGWTGSCTWLFFRCSGVDGIEEGGEDGARVGEVSAEPGGSVAGSKSRSGTGVLSTGRRVMRSISSRRTALRTFVSQIHLKPTVTKYALD